MHVDFNVKWQKVRWSPEGLYVVYKGQNYFIMDFKQAVSPKFNGQIEFSSENGIFLQLHKDKLKAKVLPYGPSKILTKV